MTIEEELMLFFPPDTSCPWDPEPPVIDALPSLDDLRDDERGQIQEFPLVPPPSWEKMTMVVELQDMPGLRSKEQIMCRGESLVFGRVHLRRLENELLHLRVQQDALLDEIAIVLRWLAAGTDKHENKK